MRAKIWIGKDGKMKVRAFSKKNGRTVRVSMEGRGVIKDLRGMFGGNGLAKVAQAVDDAHGLMENLSQNGPHPEGSKEP